MYNCFICLFFFCSALTKKQFRKFTAKIVLIRIDSNTMQLQTMEYDVKRMQIYTASVLKSLNINICLHKLNGSFPMSCLHCTVSHTGSISLHEYMPDSFILGALKLQKLSSGLHLVMSHCSSSFSCCWLKFTLRQSEYKICKVTIFWGGSRVDYQHLDASDNQMLTYGD